MPNWGSLERKKREVLKALNKGKGANFTKIDVAFIGDVNPTIRPNKDGKPRILHSWLDKLFTPWFDRGYDFVGLHFGLDEWLDAGLQKSLRGANPIDSDLIGEFYMWADEDTTRRYAKGASRLNQFIQVLLHEVCHEYYRGSGLDDPTHDHHYTEGEIRTLVETLDWTLYRPNLQRKRTTEGFMRKILIEIIKRLKALLEAQNPTPLLPVPFLRITQPYGVYNPQLYPSTNYHWGLDLRAAKGTPVVAPLDGEVIESSYNQSLGYWLQFFDGEHYHLYMHLDAAPVPGAYKRGDMLARISDTGSITAVHCHLEIWNERMIDRIAQLKESGFDVTIDPAVYYELSND